MTDKIIDRNGKERKLNQNSLANLDPQARYQGKEKLNLTLLPETVKWLKGRGNASKLVDQLVTEARSGNFIPAEQPNQHLSSENASLKQQVKELERQLKETQARQLELEGETKSLDLTNVKVYQFRGEKDYVKLEHLAKAGYKIQHSII